MSTDHYEVKVVHPRMAHYFDSNGWSYLHEYQSSQWGIVDFLAIHRRSGTYCIVECKRDLSSLGLLIDQLHRYKQILPTAQLIAASLVEPTLHQTAKLTQNSIGHIRLSESLPMARVKSPSKTYDDFNKWLMKFHGFGIYPSGYRTVPLCSHDLTELHS